MAADDAAFLASLFRSTRPELLMLPDGLADILIAHQQQLQEIGYRSTFPQARALLIEADGRPAGKVVLDEQRGHVHVVDIAIEPAWRRQGVARVVLQRVLEQARHSGRDVVLSVAHDNTGARRLYDALGFQEESRDEVRACLRWRAAQ